MSSPRRNVALIAAAALIGWTGAAAAKPHPNRHPGHNKVRPMHRHHKDKDGEVAGHYSDRGAKPVKVTAGDLTLRSRALLGKDGVTTFEMSTAPFDSSVTPSGNISSLHLNAVEQVLAKDGKAQWRDDKDLKFDQHYDKLNSGGYVSFKYSGLPHGQGLHIDGKARGNGRKDDASVNSVDVVRYRPDLMVRDIDVPATAEPGTTIFMTATVIERQGELGGAADCALLVDGSQVDIAPGIWVDAAGSVSCRFAAMFAQGQHNVTVSVQNVRPGDYDDSNNQKSAQINVQPIVVAPPPPPPPPPNPDPTPTPPPPAPPPAVATLYYDMSVFEETATGSFSQDFYMTSSSTTPERHNGSSNVVYSQSRSFSGFMFAAVNLPVNSLTFTERSGGQVVNSLSLARPSLDPVDVDDPESWTNQNMYVQDDGAGNVAILQRYFNANTNAGLTIVAVVYSAMEANFHSESWCASTAVFQCQGGDFSTSSDMPTASGAKIPLASDYVSDLTIDDGSLYAVHAAMTLNASGSNVPVPTTTCSDFPGADGTTGKQCVTTSSTDYVRQGDASLSPPPSM